VYVLILKVVRGGENRPNFGVRILKKKSPLRKAGATKERKKF
jgi:hypothetical protein